MLSIKTIIPKWHKQPKMVKRKVFGRVGVGVDGRGGVVDGGLDGAVVGVGPDITGIIILMVITPITIIRQMDSMGAGLLAGISSNSC
jgi:hypothetical protein